MSAILERSVLTTWEDFLALPEPEDEASHYELQDAEVVLVPTTKSIHLFLQRMMAKWINSVAKVRGDGASEYPIYAAPLVVKVLSRSNRRRKVERLRLAAFAGGTREFWVIDPIRRTIEVSKPGKLSRISSSNDNVPLSVISGAVMLLRNCLRSEW